MCIYIYIYIYIKHIVVIRWYDKHNIMLFLMLKEGYLSV